MSGSWPEIPDPEIPGGWGEFNGERHDCDGNPIDEETWKDDYRVEEAPDDTPTFDPPPDEPPGRDPWGDGDVAGWQWLPSWFGNDHEGDGQEGDCLSKAVAEIIDRAEARVARYESSGAAELHREKLADSHYKGSLEYDIACQTEELGRYLERYNEEANSGGRDAIFVDETWGRRIATLLEALENADRTLETTNQQMEEVEDRWRRGEISDQEYDDRMHRLGVRQFRAGTRVGMGALGLTYADLGEVADQASHILQDSLSEDGGERRQEIARRIRALPRDVALAMFEKAVAAGAIPQEAANYLIREYVRTH